MVDKLSVTMKDFFLLVHAVTEIFVGYNFDESQPKCQSHKCILCYFLLKMVIPKHITSPELLEKLQVSLNLSDYLLKYFAVSVLQFVRNKCI